MFSQYVLRWLHAWGYILEFDMYYRIHIKGEDNKFFTALWVKIENRRTGLTVILNYFGTEGYTVYGNVAYTNVKQGEVIKLLEEQLNVHS